MAAFNTACQRSDNGVQAAREDKMTPADTSDKNSDKNMMSAEDRNIATKIQESHQGEVDLARWAKDHASERDVKSYADMIADDHTGAMKDLNNLMQDKHAAGAPEQKPAEARANLSKLENLSGPEFDREYMNMMVSDHQKDLDALQNFKMTAQNPDLKDYINDLIPTIQKHLEKAQDLQTKLTQSGTK
jgi:putative membrane protein